MKTLQLLKSENPYPALEANGKRLAEGLNAAARRHGVAMRCAQLGGLFTPFFTRDTVTDLATAKHSNAKAYASFFHGMLDRGFYLPPSQFEVGFVSSAHTDDDIQRFVAAAGEALAAKV
jgi:glutamate-1-semialdehyde 2,1-aminomutase